MKRRDIPYINLMEGDLWMQMHQPDSALKHYAIATETGNEYIAQMAYERMGDLLTEKHASQKAMGMYQNALNIKNHQANEIHQRACTSSLPHPVKDAVRMIINSKLTNFLFIYDSYPLQ